MHKAQIFIGYDATGSMKYRAAGYLLSRMFSKAAEEKSFLYVWWSLHNVTHLPPHHLWLSVMAHKSHPCLIFSNCVHPFTVWQEGPKDQSECLLLAESRSRGRPLPKALEILFSYVPSMAFLGPHWKVATFLTLLQQLPRRRLLSLLPIPFLSLAWSRRPCKLDSHHDSKLASWIRKFPMRRVKAIYEIECCFQLLWPSVFRLPCQGLFRMWHTPTL